MRSDVVDLNDFYRSPLGHVASRLIRRQLRQTWPNVRDMTVVGFGYATPYLRSFREEAARVVAVMPAQQGVIRWPASDPALTCLAEECELPLPDLSVDRLLLVHAVESSENLRLMMRAAWRVLADSGRMIVVVPNRRGIWARFEQRSPFGHGHPYSEGQIKRLLRDCLFTPTATSHALYIPPLRRRLLLHSAPAVERIGDRWFQAISGVVMVEASKQIYAVTPAQASPVRQPRLVALPGRGAALRSDRNDET
jgi:hypothetical protein